MAVAANLDLQLLGEGVDDRDADAVQAAGDLVTAAVAELAAGVQDGEDDLDRRPALFLVHRDRDAAAVVDDRDGIVGMDPDRDLGAVTREGLVDGVVHDLVDQMMQTHDPVEPMYIPGRLRTASRPSSTVMSWAS